MVLEIRLATDAGGPVHTISLPVNINTVSWKTFTEALRREFLLSADAVISHLILIDADGDEASGQLRDITRFKKFQQTKYGAGTYYLVIVDENTGSTSPEKRGDDYEFITNVYPPSPPRNDKLSIHDNVKRSDVEAPVATNRSVPQRMTADSDLHSGHALKCGEEENEQCASLRRIDTAHGRQSAVSPIRSSDASQTESSSNSSPLLASERLMRRFGMNVGSPLNPITSPVREKKAPAIAAYDISPAQPKRSESPNNGVAEPPNCSVIDTQATTASMSGSHKCYSHSKSSADNSDGSADTADTINNLVDAVASMKLKNQSVKQRDIKHPPSMKNTTLRFKLGENIRSIVLYPSCSWGDLEENIVKAFSLSESYVLQRLNLMDSHDEDAFSVITTEKRFWKAVTMRCSAEPGMYFLVPSPVVESDVPAAVYPKDDSTSEPIPEAIIVSSPVRIETEIFYVPLIIREETNIEKSSADNIKAPGDDSLVRRDAATDNLVNKPSAKDLYNISVDGSKSDRKVKTTISHGIPNRNERLDNSSVREPLRRSDKDVRGTGRGNSRQISGNSKRQEQSVNAISSLESKKITDFLLACGNGDMPQILQFIRSQKMPFDARDQEGLTALHVSSLRGQLEVVKYILSTTEEDGSGNGRMALSAADLCAATDNYLMTPLHYACEHEHIHVAHILLKYEANVCARNTSGTTPLHVICLRGAKSMIGLINESQVNVATDSGLSLLHCAADQGHLEICRSLAHIKGIAVNSRDDMGLTPLHYACIADHIEVAQLLVEHAAYCNPRDDDGMTPFLYTAQRGHLKTLLWLVSIGVNIYARDDWGCSAMHLACESGHLAVVKVLHERRMDLNARNIAGLTPLELASMKGHDEVAVWMEDHGAWMRPETEAQAHIRRQVDAKAEAATRAFEVEEEAIMSTSDINCKCNFASTGDPNDQANRKDSTTTDTKRKGFRWF